MIGPRLASRRALFWLARLAVTAGAATPRYIFTHLAGSEGGGGHADGTGASARFRYPANMTADRDGNAYVVDSGNHTIRKITPAGAVTTLAGTAGETGSTDGVGPAARFNFPHGIAVDSSGNVFVTDSGNFSIRKITPTGAVTTLAGLPGQSGGADGTGAAARFAGLSVLVIDRADTLYALDQDRVTGRRSIRRITPAGVVTTVAVRDESGQPVSFREFTALAMDPADNLLVVDTSAQLTAERFLRISPAGVATPATKSGITGTIGASVIDAAGNLYLTYPFSNGNVTRISPSGTVSTIGTRLFDAMGLTVDRSGNLYLALTGDHVICQVAPDGSVSAVAGLAAESGTTDGVGANARFSSPQGVTVDAAGNLYVADSATVRKVSPDGEVTTFAGAAGSGGSVDGFRSEARFRSVSSVAADAVGNIFVADQGNLTVRRIASDGNVTTLAGSPGAFGRVDGAGAAARFDSLRGAAVDRLGNLYVAGLTAIRKVSPAGVVTTIAGSPTEAGSADGMGGNARFFQPFGLAVDQADNVYVADSYNHTIRKISPLGVVTTIAGSAGQSGSADGVGPAARFAYPGGLAVDGAGNLCLADSGNGTIRFITPDGTVSTFAGQSRVFGSEDGIDSDARFDSPASLALDHAGNLYVADSGNRAIRLGRLRGFLDITVQPQSASVTAGGTVQFAVSVTAAPAPTYQWYVGGNAIPGATDRILTFSSVRTSDAGDYTVVVANSLGSVTSNKATLTVTTAPTPPAPPVSGGGGGAISGWSLAACLMLWGARRLSARRG